MTSASPGVSSSSKEETLTFPDRIDQRLWDVRMKESSVYGYTFEKVSGLFPLRKHEKAIVTYLQFIDAIFRAYDAYRYGDGREMIRFEKSVTPLADKNNMKALVPLFIKALVDDEESQKKLHAFWDNMITPKKEEDVKPQIEKSKVFTEDEITTKLINLEFYHSFSVEQAKEALKERTPGHYLLTIDKNAVETTFILLFVKNNKEISQIKFRINELSAENSVQDNILKLAPNGEKLVSPVTKETLKPKQVEFDQGDRKAQ